MEPVIDRQIHAEIFLRETTRRREKKWENFIYRRPSLLTLHKHTRMRADSEKENQKKKKKKIIVTKTTTFSPDSVENQHVDLNG